MPRFRCRQIVLILGILLYVATPRIAAAQAPPVAAAPASDDTEASPFGVNFLKWEALKKRPDAMDELRRRIRIMKDAGIYWDRDGIDKNTVSPAPGQWDWTYTDQVVSLCRQEHVHLAVILMGGPPPRDEAARQAYAEYVYQTVNRYKDSVHVWEIWNEPNIPSFWKSPDARLYTLLLKAAYAAAKRADPACTVLGGSANGPGGDWFNAIHDNGGWDYCDAVSMHPYAMSPSPVKQRLDQILRTFRQTIAAYGDKPVWITEVGWRARQTPTEEAEQARKVFETYVIALGNGIRNIDYFCMDNYDNWGLIRNSKPFVPKPSYVAVQMLTHAICPSGQPAKFIGYLPLPGSVVGFVFDHPGDRSHDNRIVILWNNDEDAAGTTVDLRQQTGLTATDIAGTTIAVAHGTVAVGAAPVLVTGGDGGSLPPVRDGYDPFTLPAGANVLYNGALDARRDPASGVWKRPDSWNEGVFNAGGKAGATLAVSDGGRNGSTCLSIAHSPGIAAWNNAVVPVEPGKNYTMHAWIKTADATGDNAAAIVWYSGNMWTPKGTIRTTTMTDTHDWTLVTADGVAPRDAFFARVHLFGDRNAGTVCFDDVSLTEN